jgi:hypothetical protein
LDAAFLTAAIALSMCLYIGRLGFYSDDWASFGTFAGSGNAFTALVHLIRTGTAEAPLKDVWARPVMALYQASLYSAFGLQPFGYHVVNACILVSGVLLFYAVLVEIGLARVLALTVSLLFALLPHYSTNHFWFSTFHINLSLLLYFISLYADLRRWRPEETYWRIWRMIAWTSVLASALAYEVAIPLLCLNPFFVIWSAAQKPLTRVRLWRTFVLRAAMLAVALIYKAAVTPDVRLFALTPGYYEDVARRLVSVSGPGFYGLNLARAITVNFGELGINLPVTAIKLLSQFPSRSLITVAAVSAITLFGCMYWAVQQTGPDWADRRTMRNVVFVGLGLFAIGYSIFLTTSWIQITATGIGNRTAIVAAMGVAVSVTGACGYLASLAPRIGAVVFSTLIACLGTSGIVVNNVLASSWIDAYQRERAIVTDLQRDLPGLPANTTLILDGVCPYVGPAIVFESNWDLTGMLRVTFRDPSLRADVVKPGLDVRTNGLVLSLYDEATVYPYRKLVVYNVTHRTVKPLNSVEDAREYFRAFNPQQTSGCPEGHEGIGLPAF